LVGGVPRPEDFANRRFQKAIARFDATMAKHPPEEQLVIEEISGWIAKQQ